MSSVTRMRDVQVTEPLVVVRSRSQRQQDQLPRTPDGKLIVASYGRMSKGLDGKLENVENQLWSNEQTASAAHWHIPDEYVLVDPLSAWKKNVVRTQWLRLLELMENGLIGGACIYNIDRLMRLPYDLEIMLNIAEPRGLWIGDNGTLRNLADANDRAMMRVAVMMACKSSDDTSRRIRDKNEGRRRRGQFVGNGPRPFGFPGRAPDADGVMAPVDDAVWKRERKALREAVDFILDGGKQAEVARKWNAAGLRTNMGGEWNSKTINQVLTRDRNAGRITHEGEIVGLAEGKPAVDPDKHDRLQAVFMARRSGRPNSRLLGSGLIQCGLCGATLVSKPQYPGGKARPAYQCVKVRKGCGGVSIYAEPVDELLHELVIERLSDPLIAEKLSAAAQQTNEAASALKVEIELAETGLAIITDKFAAGKLRPDRYASSSETFEARIADLQTQLDEIESVANDTVKMTATSRMEIEHDWSTSIERRRELLASAMRGIRIEILPAPVGLRQAVDLSRVRVVPLD